MKSIFHKATHRAWSAVMLLCLSTCLFSASAVTLASQSTDSISDSDNVDTLFPQFSKSSLSLSHFTWGADVGSSIDLGGSDMSTFDVDAYFGYKGKLIRTAAIGSGVHKAFGNQYTFIPVYAMLRTSFREKPSLVFLELKAGYSFNTLDDSDSQGGFYGSIGIGFNLAMSKHFNSHIILSYGYFGLHQPEDPEITYDRSNINYAVLRFGVNF